MEFYSVQDPLEKWVHVDTLLSVSPEVNNTHTGKQFGSSATDYKNDLVDQLSKYDLLDDLDLLKSGHNIDLSFLDFVDGNLPPQNDHSYVISREEDAILNSFLDISFQNTIADGYFSQLSDESILSSSPCSSVSVISDCSSDYDCNQGDIVSANLPEELKDAELVDKIMDIYEKSKCSTQMWNSVDYSEINRASQYCFQYTPPYSPENGLPVSCMLQIDGPISQKNVETPPCSPEHNHLPPIQDASSIQKFSEHSLSLLNCSETKQNLTTSETLRVSLSPQFPTLKQVPESSVSIAEPWGTNCTSEVEFPKKESSQTKMKQKKLKSPTAAEMRREGKKLSNRNAATRYRMKKRAEYDTLAEEEDALRLKNKELNEKIKQITTEMSYLRSLMKDMFRARGLIK